MIRSDNKVSKMHRKVRINPAMLVFLFLFMYLLIYVVFYMNKSQLTLYQVTKSNISFDNNYSGLIIRDESVVKTGQAGYVAYYVSNGTRVRNGQTVYSIDESGNTLNDISTDSNVLLDDDYIKLGLLADSFTAGYSDTDFQTVYNFRDEFNNKIFELSSDARYSFLLDQSVDETRQINVAKSDASGTISYYIDGLETLKADDKFSSYFNDDYSYSYTKLSSGNLLEKGAPVYKMLNSNTWNIIIHLNDEQYNAYKDLTYVTCILNNGANRLRVQIECFSQGDEYFAKLTLNKYAIVYFDSRFVNVELEMNKTSGLKIPNSSIIEKYFYVVPKKWFTKGGGNSDALGLVAYLKDEEGNSSFTFIETDIYDETDDEYLINTDLFDSGTLIQAPDGSSDTYAVSDTRSITGVYNANNGYCVFRKIEVLYSNNEYSIISAGTRYGVTDYDNIVLDADKTSENIIIY